MTLCSVRSAGFLVGVAQEARLAAVALAISEAVPGQAQRENSISLKAAKAGEQPFVKDEVAGSLNPARRPIWIMLRSARDNDRSSCPPAAENGSLTPSIRPYSQSSAQTAATTSSHSREMPPATERNPPQQPPNTANPPTPSSYSTETA